MNMRTLMRPIGAAMLTATLGMTWSGAAHALKFVENANGIPGADDVGSIIYAKETLLSTDVQKADDTADTTTYYNLTRDHFVSATDPGVTRAGTDLYILTYDLHGMVFTEMVADPTNFTRAAGGTAGENYVVFRADANQAIDATTTISLTAKFSVSASGGNLTMKVQNRALEEVLGGGRATKTHGPVSIRVSPALVETVKLAEPMPIAKASMAFKGFGGSDASPTLHATLGSIMIDVAGAGVVDAEDAPTAIKQFLKADGTDSIRAAASKVGELTDITVPAAGTTLNNTAMVAGDTSFVEKIGFGASCDASGPTSDIRKMSASDLTVYTDEFITQDALTAFTTDNTLCIVVDGITPISADQYTIATTYKGLANAAFPPAGKTHVIGIIGRDGTNFQIPYLTVSEKFRQRLNIVNRGSATTYALSGLRTINDGSVAALGMAEGMLDAGSYTVMMVEDMIDISGASRASGSLSMPADKAMITVSLDIVNPETGAIDTAILIAD